MSTQIEFFNSKSFIFHIRCHINNTMMHNVAAKTMACLDWINITTIFLSNFCQTSVKLLPTFNFQLGILVQIIHFLVQFIGRVLVIGLLEMMIVEKTLLAPCREICSLNMVILQVDLVFR